MRLEKCPRCELNYVRPGEKLCEVCKREMRGVQEPEETLELCPECGEHPVVAGEEFCVYCLRERKLQEGRTLVQDDSDPEDDTLEEPSELLPVVDVIEQIEPIEPIDGLDDADPIPTSELEEIDKELGGEDEDADEELEEAY